MKAFRILLSYVLFALVCACSQRGEIKVKTPARPAGQEDMIGYAAPAIDTVRVGFVGVGMRGKDAVRRFVDVPWTKTVAICDAEQERADNMVRYVEENSGNTPGSYVGETAYMELCKREDVDLVYICTDWLHHVPVALYAMEHGKHVAIEVPSAMDMKDCWDLINTSERTRMHCCILENCCYDFFEMSALAMAREGVFGEIVHAEGAYIHDLTYFWNRYWDDWRLKYNKEHKGDVYPTHGLGPVSQALDILRGDRYVSLVAMETAAFNGPAVVKEVEGEDCPDFQNGDLTCTLLKTAKGKTVLIEHDVLTPRPYDRMYQLVGTKGIAEKYPVERIHIAQDVIDGLEIEHDNLGGHAPLPEKALSELKAKYPHPVLDEELETMALKVGGHGGMDFIMDYRLIYCLHYGLPIDMDVYDLAEWCCLAELGSISIKNGGAAVEVPDFTRGGWQKRQGMKYAFSDGSFR